MKWVLPVYFFLVQLITLVLVFYGWMSWSERGEDARMGLWSEYLLALLLIGPVVGYVLARQYQRQLDILHLAIKQAAKGNLSEKLPMAGIHAFDPLYRDFNALLATIENKLRLLQQLGEADSLQEAETQQDAVLEERKRLARDLHDTVSQQLFAIHMSASALPKLLEMNQMETARQVVDQLVAMSNHAQKQMRSLIAQLRPLELEDRTLKEALEKWFPDFCNQNGLQGKLEIILPDELPEAVEYQLFLIIQEGMANVVKHAKAKQVSLALYDAGHQYGLQLTDDGVGFGGSSKTRTSYGLSTMVERARKLGGDAEIISRVGNGTTVNIRIPKFEH